VELEIDAEAVDDFGVSLAVDFETDGVAFAAVVEFGADRFEQRARFFFLEVEVAVAGDAEGGAGEDLVAAIHAAGVALDEVGEKDEVLGVIRRRDPQEAWQRAGDGEYAQDRAGRSAAFAAEEQRQTHGLVQDTR